MKITGEFTYEGKAEKHIAYLEADNENTRLRVTVNGRIHEYAFSECRLSQPLGSLPDSLFFADGNCFTAPRNVPLHTVVSTRKVSGSFIHAVEKNKFALIGAVTGIACVFLLYFMLFIPAASSAITKIVPDEFSLYLGKYSLELIDEEHFSKSRLPAEKQREVTALFLSVIPDTLKQDKLPLKIVFRHSEGGANAFTLSDGTIIVTDDLIKMIDHDDELAAILLHEMGHHYHRHVMRSLVESSVLAITFMWFTGDINGIEDTLVHSGGSLLALSYSRNMEKDADAFAAEEMKAQHRSLKMMISVFTKLSDSSDDDEYSFLSTHPGWESRIKAIENPE